MAILGPADYPAIRAALDVSLTDQQLPDAIIGLPIYRAAADADVIELDPLAESRVDAELAKVKRAAIYFCAARLAGAVVQVSQMNLGNGGFSYSRETWDPEERADDLRRQAREEIDDILTPGTTAVRRPVFFTKAIGRRGR